MKARSFSVNRSASRLPAETGGSALVISLIFIVLLTGVLVAFSVTAGYERRTVASYTSKAQSDLYAAMGVQLALARLTDAVEEVGTNGWWTSAPGLIATTVPGASAAATPVTTVRELSSGGAAAHVKDLTANFNPRSLTSPRGVIDANASAEMPVSWVYLRKDGTQIMAPTAVPAPVPNDPNPIVGRYAFWVDDESSRLNLNAVTSSETPESAPNNHPSRLHMMAPSPFLEEGFIPMRNARVSRAFNSIEEAVATASKEDTAELFRDYASAMTIYNHSSHLNRFGAPRIVLTTQKNRLTPAQLLLANAGELVFLDILSTDNTDPGRVENIDGPKLEKLFNLLYPYFAKTAGEWGLVTTDATNLYARRLTDKYSSDHIAQIILNLIEYVRNVESPQTVVLPLRGAFRMVGQVPRFVYHQSGNSLDGSFGPNGILGNSRRPHIVEMGVWLEANAVTRVVGANTFHEYSGFVKVRVYLPDSVENSVNLASGDFNMHYSVFPGGAPAFTGLAGDMDISLAVIEDADSSPGIMEPGEYRTVRIPVVIRALNADPEFRPKEVSLRTALRRSAATGSSLGYDLAPVRQSLGTSPYDAAYTIDAPGVPEASMKSLCNDDPVIAQARLDWTLRPNTFATQDAPAASTLGTSAPAALPPLDADADGNLTNLSTRPPAPAGTGNNLLGMVMSVGEIGRVHTGGAGKTKGTSWRTLRLQPRRGTVNAMVPDWLLMELFAAPFRSETPENEKLLRPGGNNVAGKVNLNSVPSPFTVEQFSRKEPLGAVLKYAWPDLSYAELDVLIENIRTKKMANMTTGEKGFNFGTQALKEKMLYSMPSEVLEVEGIADRGEACEANVARLIEHLTTRGNVFSIFTVGQRITQFANGGIKVDAETRQRVVVEKTAAGAFVPVSTTELGL